MDARRLLVLERVLLILVLVLSLLLRLAALDAFLTPDEFTWNLQSQFFGEAVARRDWAGTYQIAYPGALTLWLGAVAHRLPLISEVLARISTGLGLLNVSDWPGGLGPAQTTAGARGLVAMLTWLGLLALYPLLRRLFDVPTALIGLTLAALDPFYLGHSRLHHVDAVLTAFFVLAVVSLLVYRLRDGHKGYLVASAVAAGLATVNKSPGAVIGLWAGLALFLPVLAQPMRTRRKAFLRALGDLALWSLVAAFTFVAVWPAMWVDPLGMLRRCFETARYFAETPHENLNFFWFAIRPDPGPFFYPVAWGLRATPWVLVGLICLAWVRKKKTEAWALGLCALAVFAFVAVLTAGDKKFDRYALPAFLVLDVMAAYGLVSLVRRWQSAQCRLDWAPILLASVLLAGQLLLLGSTWPYYLSYYNPLLGGGKTAAQVLLTGWGEGLERAAAYLNAKPAAEDLLVGTTNLYAFQPFFRGQALRLRELPSLAEADYFVIYISNAQRGLLPEVSDLLSGQEAESVVVHNGIEYARIYANPLRRNVEEVLAQIGAQGDADRDLILLDTDAALGRRYRGPVPLRKLVDSDREDVSLSTLHELTLDHPHLWRLSYPGQPAISLALTAHLERVGQVGRRIVVGQVQAARYDLPEMAPGELLEPPVECDVRFEDDLVLRGYDIVASAVLAPGDSLRVRLYWHCKEPVNVSYTAFVQLVDAQNTIRGQLDSLPQGGFRPTDTWKAGDTIPDDHTFQIAADAPPGEYTLLVGLYDLTTMERLPASDATGQSLADNAWRIAGIHVIADQSP